MVRLIRQLTGLDVSARRLRFIHTREKVPPEFAAYFGKDIQFGATADEVTFARTIGNAPLVSGEPYLNKLLVRYYESALTHRRTGHNSVRAMAENAIVPLLPYAEVRIGEIARRLGLGQRTLARRLRTEGLTFSGLLAQLRRDLANRYLADGDTSITQIAWLLGFEEVSAFSKAFKRWTGEAPRATRGGRQQEHWDTQSPASSRARPS